MTSRSRPPVLPGWRRTFAIAGLLIAAPVVGGAVVGLCIAVVGLIGSLDQGLEALKVLVFIPYIALMGLIIGGPTALLIGAPVHIGLVRLGWTSVWVYALLGPVLAGAAFGVFAGLNEVLP